MPTNFSYDTIDLLDLVQDTKRPARFITDTFFPEVIRFDTKKIGVESVIEDQRVAQYVQASLSTPVRDERGTVMALYEAPYVKEMSEIRPEDAFERGPGERLGGERTPEQRYAAALALLTQRHEDRITRLIELQCIELLRSAQITIRGKGFDHTVSFERDPAATFALTGGARWNQTTSDPFTDLQNWSFAQQRRPYGGPARWVLMTPDTAQLFLARLKARDELKMLDTTLRGSDGAINLGPQTEQNYFLGRANGFEFWVHQAQYENAAGQVVDMFPANSLTMVGGAFGGAVAYGAIRINSVLQPIERYPRIIGGENMDPSTEHLVTESSPMALCRRPNASTAVVVA